jgi:hypothetical protein
VGALPFAIGEPTTAVPLWRLAGTVMACTTVLSAVSAAGSLALARLATRRDSRDANADLLDVGQARGPVRELLGEGDRALHGHRAEPLGERARSDRARGSRDT